MGEIIPATFAKPRYRELDSLRGIGTITVFFVHFLGLQITTPFFAALRQSPLGALFNGTAALMLFFVLSGFVLSLPFVNGDKPLKLTAFYTKRIFRIYPAYIVAIIFALLLKSFLFDKNGLAPFADWIKNFWDWDWSRQSLREILKTFLMIGPDFNINLIDPPVWSLVIEMKMSVILPFFILIIARGGVTLNIAFLFVIAWLTYEHNAWSISVFYLGILMAKYKGPIIAHIRQWSTTKTAFAIIISILLYNVNYELLQAYPHIQSPYKYIFSDFLIAIGSCVLLMIILARQKISHYFETSFFTFFGDISYSFYLVHVPLILTFGSLFSNRFALSPLYIFIAAFTVSVAVAYLMLIFIERPFQKMAVKLVKRYRILNSIST